VSGDRPMMNADDRRLDAFRTGALLHGKWPPPLQQTGPVPGWVPPR